MPAIRPLAVVLGPFVVAMVLATGAPRAMAAPTTNAPVAPTALTRAAGRAASESVWVVVERVATLGSGSRAEDVRRDALYGAIGDAVAQATGVVVQSRAMAVRRDSAGDVQDTFVRTLHVDGRGTAIAWRVLSERWEVRRTRAGPDVPTFHVRVRVLVLREREEPDPTFRASVRLSAAVCTARGDGLADGDELRVQVMASEEAHWVVASVRDDSVDILAPNAVEPVVTSRAREWRGVPGDEMRAAGVRLRCALPGARTVSHETILAVATRAPVAPPIGTGRGASAETPRIGLAEFNRWLAAIRPRDRALSEAGLEVRKQP